MNDCKSVIYFDLIQRAMKQVPLNYITLDVAGGNPKYRERVYCYELYHQMRRIQEALETDDLLSFIIDGEVDKRGHPTIHKDFNPDFIMHTPGDMENNGCVIEVKIRSNSRRTSINKQGVYKDLNTITCMMHCYKYNYGALLFIDVTPETLTPILQSANIAHLNEISDRVMVFFQSKDNPSNVPCKSLKEILEVEN